LVLRFIIFLKYSYKSKYEVEEVIFQGVFKKLLVSCSQNILSTFIFLYGFDGFYYCSVFDFLNFVKDLIFEFSLDFILLFNYYTFIFSIFLGFKNSFQAKIVSIGKFSFDDSLFIMFF